MTLLRFGDILGACDYPGRGILLGRSRDGGSSVCAYFITGRSPNSRNRVLVKTEDGIRTEAFDPSKVTDPSLIIYHPAREARGYFIITNGDQTDTVRDFISAGKSFKEALDTREYEPDGPNFTPRISGIIDPDGSYKLSIIKRAGEAPFCRRFYYDFSDPVPGYGHYISTYKCDGDPLPSFEGEPINVEIPETADDLAVEIKNSLDAEKTVSIFVRYADLTGGGIKTRIINKNKREGESDDGT